MRWPDGRSSLPALDALRGGSLQEICEDYRGVVYLIGAGSAEKSLDYITG
jgi:hypothetical protein